DGIGGNFRAQYFADRLEQGPTHQRIVLGQDLQGDVLVDDGGDHGAQAVELVDVFGVSEDAVGQGALLEAALLVRLVKVGNHLGMVREQALVEMGDEGFAARLQQGDGGGDDGAVF